MGGVAVGVLDVGCHFVIVRIMSVGLVGWLVCSRDVTIAVLWVLVYACSRVCLMQQWWRLLAAVRWMVWVSLSLSWVWIAIVAVYVGCALVVFVCFAWFFLVHGWFVSGGCGG